MIVQRETHFKESSKRAAQISAVGKKKETRLSCAQWSAVLFYLAPQTKSQLYTYGGWGIKRESMDGGREREKGKMSDKLGCRKQPLMTHELKGLTMSFSWCSQKAEDMSHTAVFRWFIFTQWFFKHPFIIKLLHMIECLFFFLGNVTGRALRKAHKMWVQQSGNKHILIKKSVLCSVGS